MSAPEYIRIIDDPTHGKLKFLVDKVGGGTVGKAYDGDWIVAIMRFGTYIFDGRITTGRKVTHSQVCEDALVFAQNQGKL